MQPCCKSVFLHVSISLVFFSLAEYKGENVSVHITGQEEVIDAEG